MNTLSASVNQNVYSSGINWAQLGSLAALNAAIAISWIAYHNYQPQLLQKFNFTDLAYFLIIAQSIVVVAIPPIAGMIGDHLIRRNSNYFVVFTIGISVTAMTFMVVAATISSATLSAIQGLLPFLIVIWLISMNVFHSPANSMLELFAPGKQLPVAMGVIALITELLYALEPVVVDIVDFLGATFTFITGGILIVVTGYFFRKTTKDAPLRRDNGEVTSPIKSNMENVLGVALVTGLAAAIIKNIFPDILNDTFHGWTSFGGNFYVSLILGLSAIAALPISLMVDWIGIKSALLTGIIGVFLSIALVMNSAGVPAVAGCIFTALFFSLITVTAFPFALYNLSKRQVTFGTGLFFGCMELADGLLNIWLFE